MKRRHIITLVTCIILAVAGICYSCTYQGAKNEAPVITTLSETTKDSGAEGDSTAHLEKSINTKDGTGSSMSSVESVTTENTVPSEPSNSHTVIEDKNDIYVHLCGAVHDPKVYQVKDGTRLMELIQLAGGLTDMAAGDYINQAVQVKDGQRIYIPTEEEVKELDSQSFITGGSDQVTGEMDSEEKKRININEANASSLMTLPGIGQAKADSILEYRRLKGKFKTREDLMNVPGIKEGMYSKISAYITVE